MEGGIFEEKSDEYINYTLIIQNPRLKTSQRKSIRDWHS
jgi:hypothetical protein